MTARDIISPTASLIPQTTARSVGADMPAVDVLPRLLDAPDRLLTVIDGTERIGVIDTDSMLEALGRIMTPRDDSSLITVRCHPDDYSASILAHAVEDADAHLVDLWSAPAEDGMISVTLRVRHSDPSHAVRSLERYGFDVTDARGSFSANALVADERLSALKAYLSV